MSRFIHLPGVDKDQPWRVNVAHITKYGPTLGEGNSLVSTLDGLGFLCTLSPDEIDKLLEGADGKV